MSEEVKELKHTHLGEPKGRRVCSAWQHAGGLPGRGVQVEDEDINGRNFS